MGEVMVLMTALDKGARWLALIVVQNMGEIESVEVFLRGKEACPECIFDHVKVKTDVIGDKAKGAMVVF